MNKPLIDQDRIDFIQYLRKQFGWDAMDFTGFELEEETQDGWKKYSFYVRETSVPMPNWS